MKFDLSYLDRHFSSLLELISVLPNNLTNINWCKRSDNLKSKLCLFRFSQKTNETILSKEEAQDSEFRSFFGELRIPQIAFQIYWPLAKHRTIGWNSSRSSKFIVTLAFRQTVVCKYTCAKFKRFLLYWSWQARQPLQWLVCYLTTQLTLIDASKA